MHRRHELTTEQLAKVEHTLHRRKGYVGVTAQDNPNFLNAVFWIRKTGAPWRDLPQRYGDWNNVYRRFRRWAKRGVFDKLIQALIDEEQTKRLLLDSSVVKAYQHAAGAKKSKEESEALGRSSGGWSSKIYYALNGQGLPLRLYVSGGEVHDSQYGMLLLQPNGPSMFWVIVLYAGKKLLEPSPLLEQKR